MQVRLVQVGNLQTTCYIITTLILALLPKLQRYKNTVKCVELGTEVPGHFRKQQTQTLILCACVETQLYDNP